MPVRSDHIRLLCKPRKPSQIKTGHAVTPDTHVAQNRFGVDGLRAFAMLNVAIHDALIAAWDSKYAHNRRPAARPIRVSMV
jgi:hypothetical protein